MTDTPGAADDETHETAAITVARTSPAIAALSDPFDSIVDETRPHGRRALPGSRLDRWWARILRTPTRQRIWYWGGPLLVTLVGAVLRFWDLANPRAFMFDETYYVKDALTLGNLGYEASWPDDANTSYLSGNYMIFDASSGEFVVHPPLGKWIFWIGLRLFGADNTFGWRFMSAVMGTIAIFLVAVLARALFHSTFLGTVAGGLMAIDGLAITMSRIALLDQPLMFFILLASCTLLLDRRWHEQRLTARVTAWRELHPDAEPLFFGPALWWRPWLLATAVLLGAATGVKWSGLYVIAFFGIYIVVADMLLRRRLGITAWYSAAVLKQAPVSAILLLLPASVVYLSTWTGWLVTSGGWGRHWAEQPGNAWTGMFAWVPTSLQSLWHYHVAAYKAALAITSPHSWAANPLTWPLMIRPTLVYRDMTYAPDATCGANQCIATVSTIANPILWWCANAAVLFLIWKFIRTRDWRIPFILLPIAAGYLPWLLYLKRTVFQTYTIAWLPFLILALVYVLKVVLGKRTDPASARGPAVALTFGFLGIVLAVSIFFYPLWIGTSIPYSFWAAHSWLPWSWQ